VPELLPSPSLKRWYAARWSGSSSWSPGIPILLFGFFYAVLLVSLSAVHPFWLDEVMQLAGTRDYSGTALIRFIRDFPGTAPLGYLVQHWTIACLGFSSLSARISSEICSVLSCIALSVLGRQLGLRNRSFLILLWACLPLQLRYALEARPYSQALFFAILATACFLHLLSRPSFQRALAYAVVIALGLYTVPYTLFLQFGYVAGLIASRRGARETAYSAAAIAAACFSFLPWYVSSAHYWNKLLDSLPAFKLSPKFLLLPVHEISGGGYVCSLALIALAILGSLSPAIERSRKLCLVCGIALGLFGAILSDAVFGYFFAIRQVMFILVPLTVLAVHGFVSALQQKRRVLAVALGGTLMVSAVVKNVRYLADRSENWAAAAAAIRSVTGNGACLKFVEGGDAALYGFFDSSLIGRACAGAADTPMIAVPTTAYTESTTLRNLTDELKRRGFQETRSTSAGGTKITSFYRSARSLASQ